jgi:hypothetical protein
MTWCRRVRAVDTRWLTDSTVIQPTTGPAITVTGGVFVFRNGTIPVGARVRGVGSRRMVRLVQDVIPRRQRREWLHRPGIRRVPR